ncbi:MAG: hypothetical protein NWF14_07225 [Candidatus Bathyarchaeota archaeon]|nr:hypothetical protein [Candidatus Bathyarchaeota archaeon]
MHLNAYEAEGDMGVRKRDEVVLWPVYFDSTKTRAEGRKVPKTIGRPSLTLGMIEKALRSLSLPYKLVPEAAYPRFPRRPTGLVLVRKVKPKNQILKQVAAKLSELSR